MLQGIVERLTQPTSIAGIGILVATWGIGLDEIKAFVETVLPFIHRVDGLLATVLAILAIIYNEKRGRHVESTEAADKPQ